MKFSHIDPQAVFDRFAGDKKLLRATYELFRSSSQEYLSNIQQSIESSDAESLSKFAHTFKGSVALFSTDQIYTHALALETIAKEGPADWQKARNLYEELIKLLPELSQEVSQLLGKSQLPAA